MGIIPCEQNEIEVRKVMTKAMAQLLQVERTSPDDYIRYQQWVSDVFIALRDANIGEECKSGCCFLPGKQPPAARILWTWTHAVRVNRCTVRNHPDNAETWQKAYMPLDMYDALCGGKHEWCWAPHDSVDRVRERSFVEGYTTFADLPDHSEHRIRCVQGEKK